MTAPQADTQAASTALARAFRLTPSEAHVALLLVQRYSNREIAQVRGVTEHTARRHTEKVLLKLGVHRRGAVRQVVQGLLARSGR